MSDRFLLATFLLGMVPPFLFATNFVAVTVRHPGPIARPPARRVSPPDRWRGRPSNGCFCSFACRFFQRFLQCFARPRLPRYSFKNFWYEGGHQVPTKLFCHWYKTLFDQRHSHPAHSHGKCTHTARSVLPCLSPKQVCIGGGFLIASGYHSVGPLSVPHPNSTVFLKNVSGK